MSAAARSLRRKEVGQLPVADSSRAGLVPVPVTKLPRVLICFPCDVLGPSDMIVDAATMRIATQAVNAVQSWQQSGPLLLAGGFAVVTVLAADAPHQLAAAACLTPGTWIRLQHFSRLRAPAAAAAAAPSAAASSVRNLVGEKSAINVLPPFCR